MDEETSPPCPRGRGGPGRGQGRKHLAPAEPTRRITVTLLESQAEKAERLGAGSASLGVRRALDAVAEDGEAHQPAAGAFRGGRVAHQYN